MTVLFRPDQVHACSPKLTHGFCLVFRSTCRKPAAWGRTSDSPNCLICLPPSSPRPTGNLWRGCSRSVVWRWNIQAHVPALRPDLWFISTDTDWPPDTFLSHTLGGCHELKALRRVVSHHEWRMRGETNVIAHISSTLDIRNVFSSSLGTLDLKMFIINHSTPYSGQSLLF